MSPDFSQRYDCSMSTSFSSKLRGNCPCILFPCHLSFVFSAMLPFIFLIPLCTSVLRHLAVCNTAESVLCWCVLTTSISGSSFYYYYYYYYYYYQLQLSCHSVAVVLTLVQTKQIRINVHKRNITKSQYQQNKTQ